MMMQDDADNIDPVVVAVKLLSKCIVELGTGDGYTAARLMSIISDDTTLTVVNWPSPPSGDNPWRYLQQWAGDKRLRIIFGDTRESAVVSHVPDRIDLLIIDSTHTYECASKEWDLYRPKLADGATVIIDDLDHNDMHKFWDGLPYKKMEFRNGKVGIFIYDP